MSKKIILLGAIIMCGFIYGCSSQKDNNTQHVNIESSEINNSVDIVEIPVVEKNDWELIMAQWWGREETLEVSEEYEEEIN